MASDGGKSLITAPVLKLVLNNDGTLAKNTDGSVVTEKVEMTSKVNDVSGQPKNNKNVEKEVPKSSGATQSLENLDIQDNVVHGGENQVDGSGADANAATATKDAAEKKRLEINKLLEEKSIQQARKNAIGDVIRSAEPYNYWQDFTKQPFGYMTKVVGVQFNSRWNPTSAHIDQLIKRDLGFEGHGHEKNCCCWKKWEADYIDCQFKGNKKGNL